MVRLVQNGVSGDYFQTIQEGLVVIDNDGHLLSPTMLLNGSRV